jgi:hypothetical protein
MTSSWNLTQRKKASHSTAYQFSHEDSTLGGWEDHYIINGAMRECHPNYKAHPIGDPNGFMVCMKKKDAKTGTRYIDTPEQTFNPLEQNGYHRSKANLYDMSMIEPAELHQAYAYKDRVVPGEKYLQRNDYMTRDIRYNGTGITPMRTPVSDHQNCKWKEYSTSTMTQPPVKYDINRLEQLYPIWKKEQIYQGANPEKMDAFDRGYTDYRV